MDWEEMKRERDREYTRERDRLLGMSDAEASKLDYSDQYQRMRFQREIEAADWLAGIRRSLPPPEKAPLKRKAWKPGTTKMEFHKD